MWKTRRLKKANKHMQAYLNRHIIAITSLKDIKIKMIS